MMEKYLSDERDTQGLKVLLETLYRRQLADFDAYEASVNLLGFLQVLSEIEKDRKSCKERKLE